MSFSKHGDSASASKPPKRIDLAFAMDCTGSMATYIENAQQNIYQIASDLNERSKIDLRLALVEYRDHPPEETTFVTNVLDFTEHLTEMKSRLDACTAAGGGDTPEAVADALNAVLNLSWRPASVKICVLVADAPPHGLGCDGDNFEKGCPDRLEPMITAAHLAQKKIMVYTVGCEPSINPYKDWFMAISHITSGQYVPLSSASLLSRAIVAVALEELSLSDLTPEVEKLVLSSGSGSSQEALVSKVMDSLKGTKTKLVSSDIGALQKPTKQAISLAQWETMAQIRLNFKPLSTISESPTEAVRDYTVVDSDLTREQAARMVTQVLSSRAIRTDKVAVFEKTK